MKKISFITGLLLYFMSALGWKLRAQTFTDTGISFDPMTRARAEWVDFNNDGNLDLFVSGTSSSNLYRQIIYTNNGDGTFTSAIIASLREVAYDFGDYDQDGYIDILLAGKNSSDQSVFDVYRNNNGTAFTTQNAGLTGFSRGGVVWLDIDHDQDPDIVAAGLDAGGDEVLLIYELTESGYVAVAHSLETVAYGALAAFDANNDGVSEVLVTGNDEDGTPSSMIYSIADDWEISVYSDLLPGYSQNSVAVGDYNEDGFADLAISGISSTLQRATNLYTNNQVNGFTQVSTFMDQLGESSVDFGDLNNDGLLDIILTGLDENGDTYFYYYQNNSSYAFTDQSHLMERIYAGDAALGDYDNDGDLDIFQVGNSNVTFQANLYESDMESVVVNGAPGVPQNLSYTTSEDTVFFSWDGVTDDLTDAASISYNLYISESAGGADLVWSPMSDPADGFRKIMKLGNAGFQTVFSIHSIPEGNYYWGVQALDNSEKGSAFSEEALTVCYSFSLGRDTAICENEILMLGAGASGDVVNWYSLVHDVQLSADALTYEHLVTEKDTIVAEYTKSAYGCTVYDTIIVDMIPLPDFDLGNDTLVCFQEYLELSVTHLGIVDLDSVNWYSLVFGELARDSETLSYQVLQKDTLVAETFNSSGCVNYDTLVVDVLALPAFNIGSDTAICYGELLPLVTSTLGISGLDSVNWFSTSFDTLALDEKDLDYTVWELDTIVAEVFNMNGCVNYDTLVVDVYALPDFDLGNDTSICYAESIDLSVAGLGIVGLDSVNWYSVTTGMLEQDTESFTYEVFEKDTLVAEVFNANGCVNYDSIIIDMFPLPVFDLGNDTSICYGASILFMLQDGSFDSINWISKKTGDVLLADSWFFNYEVLATDTLIAEVFNVNGCLNYDTIVVAMDPLPVFDLQDQSICYGDSVTLSIPGNWMEVNWYTFGNQILQPDSSVYRFRVEETVTLWAEVYNAAGCVDYDTLTVTMLELPEFDLGETQTYCYGDEISFDWSEVGAAYLWTNQDHQTVSTDSAWSFIATESDQLFLTIASSDGCSYSDSLEIIVNPLPVFEISGVEEICEYDTATLSIRFETFSGIRWYTAVQDSVYTGGLVLDYVPESSGYVFAHLVDDHLCASQDSLYLTVNERPVALAGADTLICYGQSVTIGGDYSSTNGLTFLWSPNDALSATDVANPLASPLTSTEYTLEVTDAKSCNAFDTILVSVNDPITIEAGADVSICLGDSIRLGGDPTAEGGVFAFLYQWSPATGLSNTAVANPIAFPETTTTYYLEVTSGYCQIAYDTITVTVNDQPEITVSEQQSVGPEESVTLFASGGVAYEWWPENTLDDPDSATPVASPFETTEYEVIVTDENGCFSTGYVSVLVQNVLFIPNLFTPNGDGNNDVFQVYGSGIAEIDFQVFDARGNRLYRTTSVEKATTTGWDGTYQGKPVPNGQYLWSIQGTYHDGTELNFDGNKRGIIKLLR